MSCKNDDHESPLPCVKESLRKDKDENATRKGDFWRSQNLNHLDSEWSSLDLKCFSHQLIGLVHICFPKMRKDNDKIAHLPGNLKGILEPIIIHQDCFYVQQAIQKYDRRWHLFLVLLSNGGYITSVSNLAWSSFLKVVKVRTVGLARDGQNLFCNFWFQK